MIDTDAQSYIIAKRYTPAAVFDNVVVEKKRMFTWLWKIGEEILHLLFNYCSAKPLTSFCWFGFQNLTLKF